MAPQRRLPGTACDARNPRPSPPAKSSPTPTASAPPPGASWHKVTTGIAPNLRWTRPLFDGFGRTLEVTTGHQINSTETAVSKVKTQYTPCACSSIGKVLRVSMPYAANASPLHWTTYD